MSMKIVTDPVPIRIDENGDARIGNTRVLLDLVVHGFQDGATPEEIVLGYPSLNVAEVYAVIAYYLRHRPEVDAYLQERERRGDEIQRMIEARQPELADFRERLLARQRQQNHAQAGQ